jgi:hypothetical protein
MRTPENFDEIKEWVEVLMNLKLNSKLFPNPRHVIENFSLGGEKNFLETILGRDYANKVMLRDPEWQMKLYSGVRLAQEIAYAIEDWDKDEVEEEVKPHPLEIRGLEIRDKHAPKKEDVVAWAGQFNIRIANV